MLIECLPLGDYQTNCYLIAEESSPTCAVIDPGYEPKKVLQAAEKMGKTIEAIFLTHGHFDHVGAVEELMLETECDVYLCAPDRLLPPQLTAGPLVCTHTYGEGDTVTAGGVSLQVLHTPGHTPGSVCLLFEDVLFSGDTLFAGSCGRTDFPGGSPAEMRSSLARLAALPGNYRVLPGHAEETTMARERRQNPFLK